MYFKSGFLGIGSARGDVFVTDDVELQKGIEAHERFRSGFDDQLWTADEGSSKVQEFKSSKVQDDEETKPRRVRTFKAKE